MIGRGPRSYRIRKRNRRITWIAILVLIVLVALYLVGHTMRAHGGV